MAYRFRRRDGSVEHALRRIAREQVDQALRSIERDDGASAIHDVRKRCKKLRGLVKLVRPSFERYADENADFRDIGRLLGAAREASVLGETYDRVAEGGGDSRLRRSLLEREDGAGAAARAAERLTEARERLALARERIGEWTLVEHGWSAIGPGLLQTFLRARTALERIGGSHAPSVHHELRKQAKYHWHHMRLLRAMDSSEIATRTGLAAELGDRLGEHHDLAMLEKALRRYRKVSDAEPEVAAMLSRSRHRRQLLEEEALRMARELFAESAEGLTERLGEEWHAWRR